MNFRKFYDEIIFDPDKKIYKKFTGTQGDTKSRGAYVSIIQSGVLVTDIAGLSMRLFYEKSDGKRGFIDAVKELNRFRVDYTNQMFAVAGVVICELVLSGANGEDISSKAYEIDVDESLKEGSIISKNERGILDYAFEWAEIVLPEIEESEQIRESNEVDRVELYNDMQNKLESDYFKGKKGDTGPRGLKGEKGDTGPQGPKGDPFEYSDFTEEQLTNLKGPQGERGLKGDTGARGETGPQGPRGEEGSLEGLDKSHIENALGYSLNKITFGTTDPSGGEDGDIYFKYSDVDG